MNTADPSSDLAWGLQRLGILACWQRGFTGRGIRVGHLDTGVDGMHPALRGRIAQFMEFDYDGNLVPGALPRDSGTHGTHIAGIICGGSCSHVSFGLAPDADLCSGMVIEGGRHMARILAGLDWMLDCQVRVLCITLGFSMYDPLLEVKLNQLKEAGALVIAPVGNQGSGRTCFPANYPGVMAVGAVTPDGRVSRFSGSQAFKRPDDFIKPNLVAPGMEIPSAKPGGGLQIRSGTSMAAAHVAGIAALLFQAKPEASAADVEDAILTTCTPLPGSSEERIGRGLINPLAAIDALLSNRGSAVG